MDGWPPVRGWEVITSLKLAAVDVDAHSTLQSTGTTAGAHSIGKLMSENGDWTLDGLDAIAVVQVFEKVVEALSVLPPRAVEEERSGRLEASVNTWAEIENAATVGAQVPGPFRAGEALKRLRRIEPRGISGIRVQYKGPFQALDHWIGRKFSGKKASDDERLHNWIGFARGAQLTMLQALHQQDVAVDEARARRLLLQLIGGAIPADSAQVDGGELLLLEAVHDKASTHLKAHYDPTLAKQLRWLGLWEHLRTEILVVHEAATCFGWNRVLWEIQQPGSGLALYHGHYATDDSNVQAWPPDWYSDPWDSSRYRYWDGACWTDQCSDPNPEPAGHNQGSSGERSQPGWYPDPWDQSQERYWDGSQWSQYSG